VKRLVFIIATVTTAACHQPAPPVLAPVLPSDATSDERASAAQREVQHADQALKGARYALEPPRTKAAQRDAASVPTIAKDDVTPESVLLRIGVMNQLASDASLPAPLRARASVVAAAGEGMLAEHFSMFWNRADSGRRAVDDLRAAVALDPGSEPAVTTYTFALLGIRNSGFRSHAEDAMGVRTSPELERMAPLLDAHRDSLLAQTLLRHALDALQGDGPLGSEVTQLGVGLDQRIAALRSRDATVTEDVDERMQRYTR
jgi:hypothetical protein